MAHRGGSSPGPGPFLAGRPWLRGWPSLSLFSPLQNGGARGPHPNAAAQPPSLRRFLPQLHQLWGEGAGGSLGSLRGCGRWIRSESGCLHPKFPFLALPLASSPSAGAAPVGWGAGEGEVGCRLGLCPAPPPPLFPAFQNPLSAFPLGPHPSHLDASSGVLGYGDCKWAWQGSHFSLFLGLGGGGS